MKTAIDSIKDLEVEVRQWQGRLDHAKLENTNLVRQNEGLKEEAKNIRAVLEQDAQRKLLETRKEASKVAEGKAELEAQRKDFEATLIAFRQEKNAFEREKQSALDMFKNSKEITDKVGVFVRLVKQEAERL